ncbi:MAG: porin [Planctomycetota bacterium]
MFQPCARIWGILFLLIGTSATLALGDDLSDSRADSQELARLETQLRVQQHEIDLLEQQLAGAQERDPDATRAEMMRQQIREILGEQEFRESLMPSVLQAGYDKGFFIRSGDDKFLMKINGQVQFRWTHYDVQSRNHYLLPRLERDDRTGFDMQRVRLTFSGHAYSPDLTYYVQLRTGVGTGYDTRLRDGYINYRFRDEFQFRAGMFKIAATQSHLTSSGDLQLVDRPMVDAVFGLSRGMGVRFWGKLFDKRLEYFVDVMNSFNGAGNRTITGDPAELDGNPGLAFRLLWHALGENPGKDLKVESDIEFHESPALDFAFNYAFNDDAGDSQTTEIPFPRRSTLPGGFGLTTTNGLQINQFGLATAFKWRGFSARGEYILRLVDPRRAGRTPFAPWWLLTGDDSTTAQHGAYVQMGYFLPIPGMERKIEAVARVGGISALAESRACAWEYSAGVNYFIHEDNVKLQADVTKVTEAPISGNSVSLANVNDQPLIFRVQLQVKF